MTAATLPRISRRRLLTAAACGALAGGLTRAAATAAAADKPGPPPPPGPDLEADLERAAARPVLHLDRPGLERPVVIESVDLLRNGREFLVRARAAGGAESVTVPNSSRLALAHPIFTERVAPFFAGKDARDLETLLVELYRHRSNYKFQGLAFWVCVAAAEMALLDLLGKLSGAPIGELFGGVRRRDIPVYRASGNRGNRPEEEVEHLRKLAAETGGDALKFRLGARMSKNRDEPPGRSEALIPMVREAFGDDMVLYADANSSYDVDHAVRIGRLMEAHGYAFFEEPCPFDHLWETKRVADALDIPVAGGEQEFSLRRFRWAIGHRAVDVAQPDLHYFGGFVRSARVARMAEAAGMPCTAHMSGSGLGYINVLHFASFVHDPGPHQEFKGLTGLPLDCPTSSLKPVKGSIRVPSGPGFGVTVDPALVRRAVAVGRGGR